MINIEQTLASYPANPLNKLPTPMIPWATKVVKGIAKESLINTFITNHPELFGIDFIDEVLDYLTVSCQFSDKDLEKIPSQGRVVIIANHPLGGIDALALIKLVSHVRHDIKVAANTLLQQIDPISELLIPIDTFGGKMSKTSVMAINKALKNEEALIIFPAGEVSRAGLSGIKDGKWMKGFYHFASSLQAPILPVCIKARNSWLFYTASFLFRPLSTLMLPHELLRPRRTPIRFFIGDAIPYRSYAHELPETMKIKLFRKHLYRLPSKKRPLFGTEKTIASPENRQEVVKELMGYERLGTTHDGKQIYLAMFDRHTPLLKEIGRLREYTFRKVGEGSGKKRDIDAYDLYYRHIIVWDSVAMEIAGAYRIGIGREIMDMMGIEGFYTSSLFHLSHDIEDKLRMSIELGRSFVQPRYWGSRALDLLWQGIGAYLAKHPHIRYMFGPVSLSESYPPMARGLITSYYETYHKPTQVWAKARVPLVSSSIEEAELKEIFTFDNQKDDIAKLKEYLGCFGLAIPTLYKQYTDLCVSGGATFHDFSIDPLFGNCIDGFICVEVSKIDPTKRQRYIDRHLIDPKG